MDECPGASFSYTRTGAGLRPAVRSVYPLRPRLLFPPPRTASSAPLTHAAAPLDRPLTVGICTRDRRGTLLRCLRSLRHAWPWLDR